MSTARPQALSQQLARETRERFLLATDEVIAPLAQPIRDRLIAMSDEMTNAREMQERRDDFLAFKAQGDNWVRETRSAWRKALSASNGVGIPTNTLSRLELIGDDVVETGILSSRLAQAVQGKASFEYSDLRLRIQSLENSSELDARDILKPEALAGVMVAQWLAVGLSRMLWTKMQDTIQQHVVDGTVNAYREANAFLISQGVMPEIDLKSFVRRAGANGSNAVPLGGGGGMGSSGAGSLANRPGAFAPASIGLNSNGGHAAHDGQEQFFGSPLGVARQRAQGVMMNLKRFVSARIGGGSGHAADGIQRSAWSDGGFPDANGRQSVRRSTGVGGAAAGGDAELNAFASAIADAGVAYQIAASQFMAGNELSALQQSAADLRRRTSDLKRRAPTTADKATVEIVALMFQAILAEERIPFSARVWFARLQMPVLRVAIAEPEFFGTLQHPARMLIDRMGSVVMGFDAAAISGSALEGEIRRVVQVIEQYPETGQRVFKLVFDEFVGFLGKYLTQSDATQRVMSVAQQVEQKETMAIQYTIELRKMLNDIPVREEIREFLFKVWAEVLAIAALKYGAQDAQTVTLKRAASELVWAASAKPNRTDRTRVIQDLPKLLQRLRSGMALLGIVGEPQEAHIKTIGATLSDAFMSKTESIPQAKIEAMATRLANLEDFVSNDDASDLPLDAASIELLLGVDAASIEVAPDTGAKVSEEMMQWANELQVGNWFMLDHNGRASQVQFVWRSDRKQLHLFAAADGRSFLIQAGRLGSYLQAGLLVPAEEETLTVRATREALAKLDANPERLLN